MSVSIADIVRRTIRHARRIPNEGVYDWPTARVALAKILADLEARSPGDPSLERLRQVIERGDRAWTAARRRGKMTRTRRRLSKCFHSASDERQHSDARAIDVDGLAKFIRVP